MRRCFGVIVSGVSGKQHYFCSDRTTADRIRRVIKVYKDGKRFTGARTLDALVQLAVERKGVSAKNIVQEFLSNLLSNLLLNRR